jgi:tagatose-1,6-bisphosphate aldolase
MVETNKINVLFLLKVIQLCRASHIRFISEFILYATKNTDDADSLIPLIM